MRVLISLWFAAENAGNHERSNGLKEFFAAIIGSRLTIAWVIAAVIETCCFHKLTCSYQREKPALRLQSGYDLSGSDLKALLV
jgi:hypothetical protein